MSQIAVGDSSSACNRQAGWLARLAGMPGWLTAWPTAWPACRVECLVGHSTSALNLARGIDRRPWSEASRTPTLRSLDRQRLREGRGAGVPLSRAQERMLQQFLQAVTVDKLEALETSEKQKVPELLHPFQFLTTSSGFVKLQELFKLSQHASRQAVRGVQAGQSEARQRDAGRGHIADARLRCVARM